MVNEGRKCSESQFNFSILIGCSLLGAVNVERMWRGCRESVGSCGSVSGGRSVTRTAAGTGDRE